MKKTPVFLTVWLVFALVLTSCGVTDPVTGQKAHDNLRSLLIQIFEDGPKDPWEPQSEFETTENYQKRIALQRDNYLTESEKYYGEVEQKVYYLIHEIKDLPEFNADVGSYGIPFQISTASPNTAQETLGPDFRLFVPPQVMENLHLYNDDLMVLGQGWYRSDLGALADITFFAAMPTKKAANLRYVAETSKAYLRVGVQFEFPESYQGYRFVPGRYEPFQEENSMFDSPLVKQLKADDLKYGSSAGMVVVKLVTVQVVDKNGNILHQWPQGLSPAKTPTPSGQPTATILPVPIVQPTVVMTPQVTEENNFCPEAMPSRMKVGDTGRVTYGDPRSVRVRTDPSIHATVLRLLPLGKQFQVIGGPECADGFVWWQIKFDSYSGYWVAEGKNGNYHIEPHN